MAKDATKKTNGPTEEKQRRTITALICPKCRSDRVTIRKTSSRSYPCWIRRTRYCTCEACQHTWSAAVAITERPIQ